MEFYQAVMMEKHPISVIDRQQLSMDAIYFESKLLLKGLIVKLKSFKSRENSKFSKIVVKIENDVERAAFFGKKVRETDKKQTEICKIRLFIAQMTENDALIRENGKWKKFLTDGQIRANKAKF